MSSLIITKNSDSFLTSSYTNHLYEIRDFSLKYSKSKYLKICHFLTLPIPCKVFIIYHACTISSLIKTNYKKNAEFCAIISKLCRHLHRFADLQWSRLNELNHFGDSRTNLNLLGSANQRYMVISLDDINQQLTAQAQIHL